jgi:glycosyltransferase involved in cell wall biosynthesis
LSRFIDGFTITYTNQKAGSAFGSLAAKVVTILMRRTLLEMHLGKWFGKVDSGHRAIIADPSLRRRAGHPFHAALSICRTAEEAGLTTLVLASKSSEPEITATLDARRCFSRALYYRKDWSFAGYEAAAKRAEKEIAGQLRRGGQSIVAFVLPTCDQTQLRALGNLISRGDLPVGLPILAWLLFPPRWNAESGDAIVADQTAEYRDAIDRIAVANGGKERLWLCCETERLRACYEAAGKIEIRLCPGPSISDAAEEVAAPYANRSPDTYHFVVAGHATTAKGYELLPDAIEAVVAKTAGTVFTIHGFTEGVHNPEGIDALDRLASRGSGVTVLRHQLTTEEYCRLLRSADVILLPYRLPAYGQRGSGIFTEATRFGIPVIAPFGSSFAREAISSRRAIGLKEHTAEALANAICEAIDSVEILRKNCRAYLAEASIALTPAAILGDFFSLVSADARKQN